jgi:hypothetical protein
MLEGFQCSQTQPVVFLSGVFWGWFSARGFKSRFRFAPTKRINIAFRAALGLSVVALPRIRFRRDKLSLY